MDSNERPLVSVVLPTYNRARTLARAVRSVLNQGYQNLELIVVDDGSIDETPAIMATFADPRVRYLKLEKNEGASSARNHGLKAATGAYIAFQDSDDEWLSDKLERQVEVALASGGRDVSVFHIKVLYGRDEARNFGVGRVCCVPQITQPEASRDYVKMTHLQNLMSPQTLMFSRSVLEKVGYFDTLLVNSVDWDFSLRLVRHTKVLFIEEPLVICYIQDDSISTLRRNMVRSQLRILLKLNRQDDVDPRTLSHHFGRIGTSIGRLGKPRLAGRLLRRAISLHPRKPMNWIRLAANAGKGALKGASRS